MIAVWILVLLSALYWVGKKGKRGCLYAFFMIYPYMPEAFGIRIGSLPRITFGRILIVWLCVMFILNSRNRFRLQLKKFTRDPSFVFFVSLILIEMLFNLLTASTEVNHLIGFVFEQVFLIILVVSMIDSRETFDNCLKYLVVGATVFFTLGVIHTLLGVNLADSLFLLQEEALQVGLPDRMGLTRASVTVSPILHGYYAVFILPIIYYLKVRFAEDRYFIPMLIAVAASVCTMTRGAILFVFIEMVLFVCLEIKRGKTTRRVVRAVAIMIVAAIPLFAVVAVKYTDILNSLVDMIKATLNVFNSDYEYSASEINNSIPIRSRLGQLTVFIWIADKGRLLTGFGDGALEQILLKYITPSGEWYNMYALDCGYAAMAGFGGLLQVTAYLLLFGALFVFYAVKTKRRSSEQWLLGGIVLLFIVTNFATVFYDNQLAVLLTALLLAGKYKSAELSPISNQS